MTNKKKNRKEKEWIPAFAGMTKEKQKRKRKNMGETPMLRLGYTSRILFATFAHFVVALLL